MQPKPLSAAVMTLLLAACATSPPAPPSSMPATPGLVAADSRPAPQRGSSEVRAPKADDRQAFVGLGITSGPHTTLLGGEVDFYVTDRVAIGPMLQLGFSDDVEIITPSFQAKYLFDLEGQELPQLAPFLQGGVGFAYLEKDRGNRTTSQLGLVLQAGGGLEARFDSRFTLASTLLVNLLPDELVGERVYWSWNILQFGVRF